ncbi:MAG: zinc-binding alcohol dehydrogenase family protein [Cellulomonadaceae bacterium]
MCHDQPPAARGQRSSDTRAGLAPGATKVLGWDAAGTVTAVGPEVERFRVGDEVWYAGDVSRDGTDAQLHAVDERLVGHKPTSLTWAQAAALPLTAITAWESLFERFALTAQGTGTLLVVGGAGGVGSIMTQLAKALTPVTVVATASRAESRSWALSMGADAVADHHELVAQVHRVAPDGVHWVFSPHTRGNIDAYAQLLLPFGHVVAIDEPQGLDTLALKPKSIAFHWELMFTRSLFGTPDMAQQGRILDRMADLVDEGRVRSTLHTQLDGFDAATLQRAHLLVDSGRAIGKTVVTFTQR